MRTVSEDTLLQDNSVYLYGLNSDIVKGAVTYVYSILDAIDMQLIIGGGSRLSELVELANLSAIIGNLFRTGIVKASNGHFKSNLPHTYPDLLSNNPLATAIEIKVALEGNKPKGHLVKIGPHITVRYVLASAEGDYTRGKGNRGNVAWLWEIRLGYLDEHHFSVSNTAGDSGKTAVINAAGMAALAPVFFDRARCPLVNPKISFAGSRLL